MKKITSLFLLFATTFSIAQSNPYRNHTFYKIIKNVGDITETIALANCNTTFSFTDFRARDRVSIAIAEKLESKQFYRLDFGEGLNYYYLWSSGSDEHRDWDHRVDGETMTIKRICPIPADQDGDGVPDNIDNCPNEIGLPALDGCPRGPLQTIDIKDFKVNESKNRSFPSGTQFDFEFKIKGNYSYAANGYHRIDLIVYKGNSTSASNELGRIYWNREDDYDIIYPNYGVKSTFFFSQKSYNTNPGQQFTMKVTYANDIETFLFTYPDPDTDGDGIPDSKDGCPNEVGPESNNGCPIPSGPAEFEIEQVVIKGKDEFKIKRTLFDSKDRLSYPSVLKLYREEELEFKVKIKNIGGSQGRVIGIHGYNNNPNAYNPDPIWGDCEFRRLDDGINLDPGDTVTFDYKYFLPAFYSGATCPAVTTSGYFWFFPDLRYINAEVVSFVLNNRSKSGKVPILELTGAIPLRAKIGFGVLLEQYTIEIYDFTGRKVISKDVSNVVEETDAAMGLPSGLYIIKSEKGDRKIFVD